MAAAGRQRLHSCVQVRRTELDTKKRVSCQLPRNSRTI